MMACFAAAITACTPQCLLLFSEISTINVHWQHTLLDSTDGQPPNVTQHLLINSSHSAGVCKTYAMLHTAVAD